MTHLPVPARRARRALAALALGACIASGPTAWAAPAALTPALSPAAPAQPGPRVWLVDSRQLLADAVAKAADGDVVELMPGEYTERLVIENRRLVIRGVRGGPRPLIQGRGPLGQTRALWTIRGGDVLLQHLEFRGARSDERAGAAVRQEGGRLVLRGCRFFDNEHGLFAHNDPKAEVVVEDGVFGLAPKVVGGLHHLMTIGRIARFEVTGTRFEQGFEGHLLKTRARESVITYNLLHDGSRGSGSLEIDIALGGIATLVGNVIGQGADTQNPVVVSYGSEGSVWDTNRLQLSHNTFINEGWMPAWFLRVHRDKLPAGVELVAVNNLLVGGGLFEWTNEGRFEGNRHATRRALVDIETHAFELPPGSSLRGGGADLRALGLPQLRPTAEFDAAEGRKPLVPPPDQRLRWSPGAFQK